MLASGGALYFMSYIVLGCVDESKVSGDFGCEEVSVADRGLQGTWICWFACC